MFDGRFRKGVDSRTGPVAIVLSNLGISADLLTVIGIVMAVGAAYVIATGHFLIAIVMLLACGLPDLLDGPIAKATGTASVRGAFLDSVADRVTDALLLGGLAWYLAGTSHPRYAVLALGVLAASFLVSYQRSKAESLGLSAKGGIMERAERMILLGVGFLAHVLLIPVLWLMLALTLLTALQRFVRVLRAAPGPAPATLSADPEAADAEAAGVTSGSASGEVANPHPGSGDGAVGRETVRATLAGWLRPSASTPGGLSWYGRSAPSRSRSHVRRARLAGDAPSSAEKAAAQRRWGSRRRTLVGDATGAKRLTWEQWTARRRSTRAAGGRPGGGRSRGVAAGGSRGTSRLTTRYRNTGDS